MQDTIKQNLKIVNFTGIAAVTLLLAGTLAFGIYPLYDQGRQDLRRAAEMQATSQRVGSALPQDVQNARAQVQVADSRLKQAEQRLPAGPPDNGFINELSEIAKASGIRIESQPPVSDVRKDDPYLSVVVSVEGTGDWESCQRFLRGINHMNRLSRLDSVVLDTERAGNSQFAANPACHLLVKFSTYYLER